MWEYALLGTLQGIFEWIPVSSEGVVALVSQGMIKSLNSVDLAIFLHLGTLLALFVYFLKDWKDLLLLKDKEFVKFFIIVTIISGAIGFGMYKMAKEFSVGWALLMLTGLGLLLTSFFQSKQIKWKISNNLSAIIVGVLQGLSAIPGVSRSGSTIFGLSLSESNPKEILRKSYLISAPVVMGSSLYLYLDNPSIVNQSWVGLIFSFIFGLIFLKMLLTFADKINFSKFTLIFGLLCILGSLF
ncbi:MAG: undecaprenyl-diphosphate phosphatase, partial [Candidatus Pacebacteria bacterium]|nr:undecaprenyl-diphosphate phosphatase [Candidatus Paceibacterota bacterium]